MKHLIIVRGGGELGSGVAHCLHRAGFRVLILEQKKPTATRRKVSFSDAMYRGETEVERVICHKAKNLADAQKRLKKGEVMMIADPEAKSVAELHPDVVVDAVVAHENHGMKKDMAGLTIALGPGFCAGRDVDVVVETGRGHNLGRLIYEGYSSKDADHGNGTVGESPNIEHLVFAPAEGRVEMLRTISLMVKKGEIIGHLHTKDEQTVEIQATIDGVLRGAVYDGIKVAQGQKIADIHPTMGQEECYTISDKARCIGGSVLEAIMAWESKRSKHRFFGR
ncbi:selenium-dependent molybdenum cofactor biosynthesis protein YqeB [uncultured Mitsuokella sp.]|uniref:selenium-dependent molybdenum cofactor biosynthesis protein YqeB n=1 Tax=uncultured Mitsuokella sp. TaxID=453120 RepID=UPI00266F6BEF|nr:selenium-dependent molybdenum cofactor biosynthesis protein YqeB [uncultured Mitsuokella sp.]